MYATALCGSSDATNAVAIDGSGASYVAAAVHAAPNFPLVQPVQGYVTPGSPDPQSGEVVLKLDPSGTVLWSTYLGFSSPNDQPSATDKVAE